MTIALLELNSCCFFVSLRTGSKLFGFISLIGCFLLALLSGWEIVMVAKYVEDEFAETAVELSADIVVQAIQISTSVLMLLGVYQEKRKLIPPWLVSTIMSAILEIVFMPSLAGRMVGIHHHMLEYNWIILTLFMILDDIYGWLVVYSYYRTLSPHHDSVAI